MTPRVLVADDRPSNLRLMVRGLEKFGIPVIKAASGAEALSLGEALRPDVAVLDAIMPDIHGFEVCRRFKRSAVNTSVLMVTGDAQNPETYAEALAAGAADCIWKPLHFATLAAKVRALLGGVAAPLAYPSVSKLPIVRALLVEDDISAADYWMQALSLQRFEVEHAGSAGKALSALERDSFDAVLIDLLLPGAKSGLDLTAEIRAMGRRDISTLPVAVLSALCAEGHKMRALDAGADDYFHKSCPAGVVSATIRARLARVQRAVTTRGIRRGRTFLDEADRAIYTSDGSRTELAPQEFAVVRLLMSADRDVSTDEIADTMRGPAPMISDVIEKKFFRGQRTHAAHEMIRRLRRKIPLAGKMIRLGVREGYGWLGD